MRAETVLEGRMGKGRGDAERGRKREEARGGRGARSEVTKRTRRRLRKFDRFDGSVTVHGRTRGSNRAPEARASFGVV